MSEMEKLLERVAQQISKYPYLRSHESCDSPMDALKRLLLPLLEAADHLKWATGVEIQGGHRTRSFKAQHRAKCRYWIEQIDAAKRQAMEGK